MKSGTGKGIERTTVKAQGLLASLQKPEFVMAFVVVKNCLQLLRGMTTKLQKRDIDIVSAYNMIDDSKKKITDLRANIGREHADWYNEAQPMAKKVEEDITTRNVYLANVACTSTSDYYQVNYTATFVDHLHGEFGTRFSNDHQVGVKLLRILPSYICTQPWADLDQVIHDLALWEGDLSHPATLEKEIRDWFKLWSDCEATGCETLPTNLLDALCQCDPDVFPCIHRLLTIGCTLPITSCEAGRSFSVIRRTMNYMQSTMGRDRLTGLILMHKK